MMSFPPRPLHGLLPSAGAGIRRVLGLRASRPLVAGSLAAAFAWVWMPGSLTGAQTGPGAYRSTFRVGFSAATFSDVNENDAKAAMKVWTQMLFNERGLSADPEPRILKGPAGIAAAFRHKLVDAIALPVDEYWQVREEVDPRIIIVGSTGGKVTEEYVLLVHRDSGIGQVEDLRGRGVAFWQNTRTSLAPTWLDVLLLEGGRPQAIEFCRVTHIAKLSKVVLPVFFRQTDACVVTRQGFQNLSELNPQLRQRLKVLAASPEFVPGGFCFRRGYDDPMRELIIKELDQITTSATGAQVLTLFQSGALVAQPVSCLDSAFTLLASHARLMAMQGGARAVPSEQPVAAGEKLKP